MMPTPTPASGDAPTQRARPQGNAAPRRAPSPDGKVKSHLLPVVDGEAPVKWATRFGEFVQKAASVAEIDDWYNVNAIVFDKLKTADTQVYNDAIDFMDACTAKLTAAVKSRKPADPISSGNGKTNGKAAENAETPQTISFGWIVSIMLSALARMPPRCRASNPA